MTEHRRWARRVAAGALIIAAIAGGPAAHAVTAEGASVEQPTAEESAPPANAPTGDASSAQIEVQNIHVQVGATLSFSVQHSAPGELVTAIIASRPQPTCDCAFVPHIWDGQATTDPEGTASFSAVIPAGASPGQWYVSAVGPAVGTLVAPFQILSADSPAMTVSSTHAVPGEEVGIRLSDFPASRARLALTVPGGAPSWWELGLVDVVDGSYTGTIVVPRDVQPGAYQLWAIIPDSVGVPAVADLTVTADTPPAVSLDGATVRPGTSLGISASGFAPNETVRIELHSTPVILTEVPADAGGALQVRVALAQDVAVGEHHIVATGLSSGRTATTALTVQTSTADGPSAVTTPSDVAAVRTSTAVSAAGGTEPGARQLAVTGSSNASIFALAVWAVALLVTGAFVKVRRSRG